MQNRVFYTSFVTHSSVVSGLLAATLLAASGCRQAPAPAAAAGPVKHYPISGKVIGTNAASEEVELDGAAIPGFMAAMIMPYRLANPPEMKNLHRGDRIAGTLDVGGAGTTLSAVRVLDRTEEIKELEPQSIAKPLVAGEAVPDFTLTDQNGRTLHLASYRGKTLLITFVYTNCPLADFCPRMSHNFADIDKQLAANPTLYAGTHLLTVSFDPVRDTPAALRSYGGAYTGRYTDEHFDHWTFAVPKQRDLASLLDFFDVGAVPRPGGSLEHTLSTIVVGPDGKVAKWYPGNQWTPADLLSEINKSLGGQA